MYSGSSPRNRGTRSQSKLGGCVGKTLGRWTGTLVECPSLHIKNNMKYEKSISSQLFKDGTEVTRATHKGVELEFIGGSDSIMVIHIESHNARKGEAQETLALLKADFPGRKYRASIPLNAVAEYLFTKMGFDYSREEAW